MNPSLISEGFIVSKLVFLFSQQKTLKILKFSTLHAGFSFFCGYISKKPQRY